MNVHKNRKQMTCTCTKVNCGLRSAEC